MEKYIKVSDVKKILNDKIFIGDEYTPNSNSVIKQIETELNILESIHNPVFILENMIQDANNSMYPDKGQLDMKEFNVFSCGKASLEIALDRIKNG